MPTYYVESVNSFHFILFWICCHKWLDDEKLFVTSLKTQYYFANTNNVLDMQSVIGRKENHQVPAHLVSMQKRFEEKRVL